MLNRAVVGEFLHGGLRTGRIWKSLMILQKTLWLRLFASIQRMTTTSG